MGRPLVPRDMCKSSDSLAMPKGKRVRSGSKTIIYNVYRYFEHQCVKQNSTVPLKLSKKTADATGFSERTVNRVVSEKRKLDVGPFPSPSKRNKKSREHVNVDDFDTDAIRRTVHEFYERREYPTLYFRFCTKNSCFTEGGFCCGNC